MPPIILAVTPSHRCDPSLAIAANRAGAVGLLDLGLTQPVEALRQAIERLDRYSSQPSRWGVRWDTLGAETRMPNVLSALRKEPFPYLLLAGLRGKGSSAQIRTALEQARTLARVVLLEVYDAEAARAAATSGIDGVVIKAGEAGGRVSSSSAFMLLQTLRGRMDKPYWIQGAWGPDNAASAVLAGAAGVVLGEELWLARESPFQEDERQRLAGLDGSETVSIGTPQVQFRLFKQGSPDALNEIEQRVGEGSDWPDLLHERWLAEGFDPLPLGQGIAFAAGLARRHVTAGGILNEFNRVIEHNLTQLKQQPGLMPGNALAEECGIHHPIFQGPMTRVSDVVPFCASVAENGALPFLALALLRGREVRKLLEEARERLGERSWGVGILGFVPPELRKEQLDVVLELKPRFAIIAGGRPAQAKELEEAGIATYLHVPSPGLLESFLREGARKFIFEGRECGGHVGPRTSLTLWQSALDVLRETPIKDPENLHVIFAGGIHDDFSAALVSALAPALVERGAKIGVLMGTAYLFTEEAVASGAITPMFQEQAASCEGTTLLESGVGHATRCARTPFADEFEQLKKKLIREGRSGDEIRLELEMLNVGRLRLASKGLRRQARPGNASPPEAVQGDPETQRRQQLARGARLLANGPLEEVNEETQRREGLYMIGEVAAFRDQPLPMARLHEQVAAEGAETAMSLARKALEGGAEAEPKSPAERAAVSRAGSPADSREERTPVSRTERAPVSRASRSPAPRSDRPAVAQVEDGAGDGACSRKGDEAVAIIGMACQFPEASDLRAFWRNIVNRVDAVRDVPPDRWNTDLYYSPDRLERDKIYSKTGGFLGETRFDPVRYGIPPASLAAIEPIQLITLETARLALEDAGYGTRPFPRERTAVIFGAGGVNERGMAYAMRTMLPQYLHQVDGLDDETRAHIITNLNGKFPEWTEDSFPGFLFNVISGRVANRLDLQGPNFVVDAACAASLAALHTAVQQLRAGLSDMALVGGADGTNNALGFMSFAKTHALTPGDKVRPFDEAADGVVLGEGVAAVVLKRLGDAERDGDRIYAVIRGVGSSSDGRNRSLTAPHAAAQAVALRRAYADAGIQPETVSLVEAHATGTAVGDRSEIEALKDVFDGAEQAEAACAIGSVKSMIGHTKSVAGIAGLIKTALALKHRVLPPTINVEKPNKAVENSPFFISTETRPWIHHGGDHPRRAGVSAFGFGGTNFHVALEEHTGDYHDSTELDLTPRPAELFLFRRPDAATFVKDLSTLAGKLDGIPDASLRQLAYSLHLDEQRRQRMSGETGAPAGEVRLGLLASSVEELRTRLERACELAGKGGTHAEPGGFHLTDAPPADPGQVCFLFPGQGSQRINMLKDLVQFGPFGPDTHEAADRLLWDLVPRRLSSVIYPAPVFSPEMEKAQQAALNDTRFAQPALGVTNLFAADVLNRFGLTPAFAAGHSYGEYVALCAGGGCTRDDLLRLSALRGQAVHQAGLDNPGAMAAVTADEEKTRAVLDEINLPLHLANLNAPNQTIIAGPKEAIEAALKEFRKHRLAIRRIPVTAAFHTPAMEEPLKAFAAHLEEIDLTATKIPVFSNVSAEPYTTEVKEIRHQLAIHLARPVRFVEQIQALHRAGARIFIETGPGRILSGLVKRILADQDHETLALDMPGQPGWLPLGQLLAKAAVLGLPVEPAPWFQSRGLETMGVEECLQQARKQAEGRPSDYYLSPGRSRSVREPAQPPAQAPADATRTAGIAMAPPSTAGTLDPAQPSNAAVSSTVDQTAMSAASVAKGTASVTHDPLLSQLQENMSKWLELHRENQRMSERFLQLQERIVDGLLAGRGTSLPSGRSASPPGLSVAPAPVLPDLRPTGGVPGAPASSPSAAPVAGEVSGQRVPQVSHPGADLDVKPVVPAPVGAAAPQGVGSVAVDPATQETATVDPASPTNGVPSVEEFQRDLVAEVSRRTGYPEDTLDMDMALEAGLGIDSIKIMEIFSALKSYHQYLADEDQDEEEVLVQFTEMKTLGKIVEHYTARREQILSGEATPSPKPDSDRSEETVLPEESGEPDAPAPATRGLSAKVERLVLRSTLAPPDDEEARTDALDAFPRDQLLLVLGDAPELASSVEAALSASGFHVVQVVPGPAFKRVNAQRYEACLTDPASVEALARGLKEESEHRVGALINLLTLAEGNRKPGLNGYDAPLELIQSLANVARAFETDLRESAAAGGGRLINVTTLDGRFGLRGEHALPVVQAGSLGFFKSLAREWRGVKVKTIDMDPNADARHLVVGLLRELATWDDQVEVGLDGDGRWRLELINESISDEAAPSDETAPLLEKEAVILVTGGAHGITSAFARRMAAQTRARLIIVGRSRLTAREEEPAELRDLSGEAELRAALIEEIRTRGGEILPAEVERDLKEILKSRAIRDNLEAMRATGAEVEYHSLDVRDDRRFGALMDDLYDRFGRIDGVIHGAGVVEDGWLRNKNAASVSRVFDTKVRSALVLARKLRPESLRFLVFFSSLSGRMGNAGQVDYSAANEFLNKLAAHLDHEWPGRVVAINWGPWDTGMMSEGLRSAYRERGIELIPVEAGIDSLMEELRRAVPGEPEVVLTCSPRELASFA